MLFLPRRGTRLMPPVSKRWAKLLSISSPRRLISALAVLVSSRRRFAYTAACAALCPDHFCRFRSGSAITVRTPPRPDPATPACCGSPCPPPPVPRPLRSPSPPVQPRPLVPLAPPFPSPCTRLPPESPPYSRCPHDRRAAPSGPPPRVRHSMSARAPNAPSVMTAARIGRYIKPSS
jgi:hypothetical protein